MATFLELSIDQGADFQYSISITDDTTGLPANLDGYTITSSMKKSYYSANSVSFNVGYDRANGNVVVSLTNSQTANLDIANYVYDVAMLNPSNEISRILEGVAIVNPKVT